jgi:hypothetical protein
MLIVLIVIVFVALAFTGAYNLDNYERKINKRR